MKKRCPKCEQVKPPSEFHNDKRRKDGVAHAEKSRRPIEYRTLSGWSEEE